MNVVTTGDLAALAAARPGPCVSMFQPTHRAGPDPRSHAVEDAIRFRNLLRGAERVLSAAGLRPPEVQALLAPARRLLEDSHFWQHQADGLAVYLAPGFCQTFRVPLALDEEMLVGRRFAVLPLVPLLTGDGLFHVLALSQGQVRLFAGTRDHLVAIELPDAPRSLSEALRYDDPERQLQFHTRAPRRSGGERAAVFHGHGVGRDDARDNALRFCQQVDRALTALLGRAPVPLVLAAVDWLAAIYREASRHPGLLDAWVPGNPDRLDAAALHARAWPLVEPRFTRQRQAALADYRRLAGTGRTAAGAPDVVLAAVDGRVEVLLMAARTRLHGVVDQGARTVVPGPTAGADSEDLIERAVTATLGGGGTVYALRAAEMPEGLTLAAVLRY